MVAAAAFFLTEASRQWSACLGGRTSLNSAATSCERPWIFAPRTRARRRRPWMIRGPDACPYIYIDRSACIERSRAHLYVDSFEAIAGDVILINCMQLESRIYIYMSTSKWRLYMNVSTRSGQLGAHPLLNSYIYSYLGANADTANDGGAPWIRRSRALALRLRGRFRGAVEGGDSGGGGGRGRGARGSCGITPAPRSKLQR